MKSSQLPFKEIGQFTLQRVIQDGPYTMAVQSFQPSLHRPVFIKLLKPQIKNQELWLTRFKREARICARLKHPNIVDVYTIGEIQNYTYMAMEFVRGISLKELLEREKKLPEKPALQIVSQILQALQYAHQNKVIHRDLKPGNILLDIHGVVKLTDFGLAYLGEEFSVTLEGDILGTPAYMAPEQITGEPLTQVTDLFALGATFYEMLTGIKPFAGENYSACIQKILIEDIQNPSLHDTAISDQVAQFVLDLIAKNPDDRPAGSKDALTKVEKFMPQVYSADVKSQLTRLVQKYYDISAISVNLENDSAEEPLSLKKKFISKRKPALIIPLFFVLAMLVFLVIGQIQKNNVAPERNKNPERIAQDSTKIDTSDSKKLLITGVRDSIIKNKIIASEDSRSLANASVHSFGAEINKPEKQTMLPSVEKNEKMQPSHSDKPKRAVLVTFDITPWASVSVDGKLIDSLMVQGKIEMMPGKHQLILIHPRFTPKIMDIDIKKTEQQRISYSFLKDAAFLSIEARPWAEVYIDRKFIDDTPLNQLIVLAPGEHLLELKHSYYRTYRQMLYLNAGDTLQIKHAMAK